MKTTQRTAPRWLNHLYNGLTATANDGLLIDEVKSLLQEELHCSSGEAEFLIHQALSTFRKSR